MNINLVITLKIHIIHLAVAIIAITIQKTTTEAKILLEMVHLALTQNISIHKINQIIILLLRSQIITLDLQAMIQSNL